MATTMEVIRRTPLSTRKLAVDGVLAGLTAGVIFAVFEMIVAGSAAMPWRAFASILGGQDTMAREFTFGIFVLGFVVHFGLSAIFGAISKVFPDAVHRNLPSIAALGMAYGLLVWVLNFGIIANLFFPWFTEMSSTAQILLHILTFGLPLGIAHSLFERALHRRAPQQRAEAV